MTTGTQDPALIGDGVRVRIWTMLGSGVIPDRLLVTKADATAGPMTLTLPSASSVPGQVFLIQKVDSTSSVVTVAAAGSDLIQGAASTTLTAQYQSLSLISDGTNWLTPGQSSRQNAAFKFAFPGDLNTAENDLVPQQFLDHPVTVTNLAVCLVTAPTGQSAIVTFKKVNLSTGVLTTIGTVTVTAGSLYGSAVVSPGVVIGTTEGVVMQITQIGSINPGHTATGMAFAA